MISITLKRLFFPVLILLLVVSLVIFKFLSSDNNIFSREIADCHREESKLRFSCYRAVLEKYYQGKMDLFVKDVKSENLDKILKVKDDLSYANFGTNCHTFYHAAGDYIAEHSDAKNIKDKLNICPKNCTSGCTMGLFKRTALQNNFSTDTLKEFFQECREGENHQCAHEIGHLLQDKYFYSILKVLDEISDKEFGLNFKTKNYNYLTYPNSKSDFNAPFEECKQILPENELPYCYTGIGHNLFLFSEFSGDGYKSMFAECDKVKKENQDNCYGFLIYRIGINEAGPRFLSKKFEEGKKICDETVDLIKRNDLKHHCYLGLGGGIGLFIDTEYFSLPQKEERLAQTKKEIMEYAKLCEESPKEYIDKCLSGLMGTRFKLIYKLLRLYDDKIEKILPELDDDFEVVG